MPDAHDPSIDLDAAIETIAEVIHQHYLADAEGVESPDHPSVRPWDELAPEARAQNRQQARENVQRLAALGLLLVPATEIAAAPEELAPEVVEALARDEHDRWARQKRAQGYRWGEVRSDDPADRRHPDLIAWEDLTEEVRDKDRDPMRRMMAVLAAAGLRAVDADDRPPGG